ncbi:MAG: S-adenosylmethionine decarboxylase [Acidobacteria bacterium]|nr:MAG: S-adenosylmethionine decarboxylase [Acidobacteriota bacterium]
MKVGYEWIVDAFNCDSQILRNEAILRGIFSLIISDLKLNVIEQSWHCFPGAGGVTGLALLSESHLACHTYPEYKIATFNLYCCNQRPEWEWEFNLKRFLGAEKVRVLFIQRGGLKSSLRTKESI